MYRAIIFDLFFTLVRFELAELDALFERVRLLLSLGPDEFARQLLPAYVRYESGDYASFEELLEQLAQECRVSLRAADVAQCAAAWRSFQQRALQVSPEVTQTLAALHACGFALGLISNTMAEVPSLWRASPVSHLFKATVFSCEAGVRKPAPEIYLRVCEMLDVPPQQCVFVGDGGGQELSGAARIGMRAVQLRWPDEPLEMDALLYREPWHGESIAALAELLPMVPGLNTPSYPARKAAAAPSSRTTREA
jgi:putative hydrolase of the HAD superfamily